MAKRVLDELKEAIKTSSKESIEDVILYICDENTTAPDDLKELFIQYPTTLRFNGGTLDLFDE